MKNKILILMLSLVLVFSLTACGDKEDIDNYENVSSENTEEIIQKNDEEKNNNEIEKDINNEQKELIAEKNINDFDTGVFIENCDFIHVLSEDYETSNAQVSEGIQVQKLVYNVDNTHKIFVNSEVDDSLSALMILRVGTNKISDINRINVVDIADLDKDLYTVDVIKTPCCHYYVFKLKMPLTEDSVAVGFGVDEYVSYHRLSDMKEFDVNFTHNGESLFTEGGIASLENGHYIVARNERELAKDISSEDEHIALKQSVIELLPLTGTIKMEQFDSSKWHVRSLDGTDLFETEDEMGGFFTYVITTVSPEYRNQYNNDLVHSIYVTYKYINENLTGDELENQMNKIISNSIVSYVNDANEFYRNFAIN